MKRETIITTVTAVVFFSVGFLAGYIYNANQSATLSASSAVAGAPPDSSNSSAAAGAEALPPGHPPIGNAGSAEGLPPGHPPIDNSAAIQALEQQAAQNPRDPQPPLKLANLFFDQHQFDQAADWYQKAIALDPKNVNALTDLGTVYFNLGRPEDALREYQKSLAINPDHEPTMFNMIIVNFEGAHNLAAARAAWNKLHKRDPNYPGLDQLKQSLDSASASPSP